MRHGVSVVSVRALDNTTIYMQQFSHSLTAWLFDQTFGETGLAPWFRSDRAIASGCWSGKSSTTLKTKQKSFYPNAQT